MMERHSQAGLAYQFSTGLNHEVWDFTSLALMTRFAKALEDGSSRYPIYRTLRFAARIDLEALFDALAMNTGWRTQRLHTSSMILETPTAFVSAEGARKADYCSCFFGIWAKDIKHAEWMREGILAVVGAAQIDDPMFSVDWHFLTSKGELKNASIEEMADDVLLDAAYPDLEGGVEDFITRYLDAPETVLVLQGPPGTGKTRLIRAILGAFSRRLGGQAQALYTGDMKALESDEIFVKFITGWHHAFVVEDADHVLKPRAEGNEHLHRFLAIADGVVRAQGRKIIFSTNLPNVGDLDDALIRPGRCFARVMTRALAPAEVKRLLAALCPDNRGTDHALSLLAQSERNKNSLAEVYKAISRTP